MQCKQAGGFTKECTCGHIFLMMEQLCIFAEVALMCECGGVALYRCLSGRRRMGARALKTRHMAASIPVAAMYPLWLYLCIPIISVLFKVRSRVGA